MRSRLSRLLAAATAAILLASCASLAVRLAKAHSAIEKNLAAVDDGERLLCFGTTDISGIPKDKLSTCSAPAAKLANLTDARHQQISKALKEAFDAQVRLGPVLKTWTANTPPKDLTDALADAKQVGDLVAALDPKAAGVQALIDKAGQWLTSLNDLLKNFGGGK